MLLEISKKSASHEGLHDEEEPFISSPKPRWSTQTLDVFRKPGLTIKTAFSRVQWLLIILLALVNIHLWQKQRSHAHRVHDPPSQPAAPYYSPAQGLIQQSHGVVFSSGFEGELSKYQGRPSPENEQAWSDLYNFGISRIPMSDAAKIANRTIPIPNDPGYYAVGLDVFHQLHCLNMVRKRAWSHEDFDPSSELMSMEHIDHCIDSIRQSLMCHADVTPLPFMWSEASHEALAVATVLHSCKDFGAVHRWGRENHVRGFDRKTTVHDPLDDDPNVKGVKLVGV